jgi:heme exporter protein B
MDSTLFQRSRAMFRIPQDTMRILLVFLSLVVAFGILSSHHQQLWQSFLPILLMGLSYGIMSLSLNQLFQEDWEDGTLEWWISENKALESYVIQKLIIHWIRLGLPMILFIGIQTGFLNMSLLIGVTLTTLTLTLLGAIPSALCLSAKANNSLLLPLLTLPLGIPIMIVSMAAVHDPSAEITSYIMLQIGLLLLAAALFLAATPFALRLSLR